MDSTTENVDIEDDQVGVQIQSVQNIIILQINDKFIIVVLAVSWLMWLCSLFYLLTLRTKVGRLQVDTVIHSLTIGGKSGPGIPDSGLAGLNQVKKEFGNTLCRFGAIQNREGGLPGRVEVDEEVAPLREGEEYL